MNDKFKDLVADASIFIYFLQVIDFFFLTRLFCVSRMIHAQHQSVCLPTPRSRAALQSAGVEMDPMGPFPYYCWLEIPDYLQLASTAA